MGPPGHPASAMRTSRPNTPSTPSSGRAPSPHKKHFRPPGKPVTPGKERLPAAPSEDKIYTPPRAFVRDHSSRIGRPTRDGRRSISTNITVNKDEKPAMKPTHSAGKVKSMYDLRAAASRSLSHKPSLPSLPKVPATPPSLTRAPSYQETSPQTGLLKARRPGENVIAPTVRTEKPTHQADSPAKKTVKGTPTPNESMNRESTSSNPSKSSAALRDTIAKAKAARREALRKSEAATTTIETQTEEDKLPSSEPAVTLGTNSLKKKLEGAVMSGVLNLSALGLKVMPQEVQEMYDFKEDSTIVWSEAIDLKKFLMADNEIEALSDTAFPDWSPDEMRADAEKSNQFGGLEVLDLHGNLLKTIPIGFRQLSNLRILNLSSNNLSLDAFSIICELDNLRELRMAKNGMSGAVPAGLAGMRELQVLDLSDNQFDELSPSISELRNLQKLLAGGNRFTSISLAHISSENMIEIDVSRNMLDGAFAGNELQRFGKLQTLDVSANSLQVLCSSLLELPSLQVLITRNNRFARLPDLSACPQMTTLVASENSLTELPEGLAKLGNLRNVDFSSNSIKHLGTDLAAMSNLVAINFTGNPLRERKYLTMNADEMKLDLARKAGPVNDASPDTIELMTPDSQGDGEGSTSTETNLFQVKGGILDISSRNLSSLSPSQVHLNGPVHTIRLANNDLTAFPVELLMHPNIRWNLRSLDMSHNPGLHSTEYLQEELHLPLLQSLYIVSTGLTTLDTLTTYLKAPELKELNISCHRLTGHIPWVRAWYPSLTTLLASDNWFESIDVEAVRGLEVLDIRNNEVDSLPPKIGLFGNHGNKSETGRLRSFECSGNKFRVPRLAVIERGTEAILKDLRRMIPLHDVPQEWANEI